jgi:DNA-binding transcriptional regulator YiaG
MARMDADEIRQLRKRLKLTGDKLGKLLGVTGNTVRRWECGARRAKGATVALLRVLADEADCSCLTTLTRLEGNCS